jgi:predicted RNase H-like HicB family nuclease
MERAMKITAIVHEADEGGFWAEVPALPGCVSQGETLAELETNLREAIEGYLQIDLPPQSANGRQRILELAL